MNLSKIRRPALPLPPPLKAAEEGTFTRFSVVVRLPEILRRMMAENDFSSEVRSHLEELIAEIPETPLRPLHDPGAPDEADWVGYLAPYRGQDWLHAPWFLVEAYFYRRILAAIGYFQPGPAYLADPFAHQKRLGLETSHALIAALCARVEELEQDGPPSADAWARLLETDLWGNRADLSLWPAGKGHPVDFNQAAEHILVDDRQAAAGGLARLAGAPARLDWLVDNAGFELVADLCLVDYWLASHPASSARLHLKAHPTFVSDALPGDVQPALAFLAGEAQPATRRLGQRLGAALADGRLRLRPHLFWNSPLPLWEAPAALLAELGGADWVITKGDAHYRRLLGDLHWPFTTPFGAALAYFPAPLLALRTLKSEIVAGLRAGQAEQTSALDKDWLSDGRWGLVQLYLPSA